MKNPYGHFDDPNREYVITRPDTPLPWLNYLGQDEFFGLCTNTAGGYTFWKDAKLRAFDPLPLQQRAHGPGRAIPIHQ